MTVAFPWSRRLRDCEELIYVLDTRTLTTHVHSMPPRRFLHCSEVNCNLLCRVHRACAYLSDSAYASKRVSPTVAARIIRCHSGQVTCAQGVRRHSRTAKVPIWSVRGAVLHSQWRLHIWWLLLGKEAFRALVERIRQDGASAHRTGGSVLVMHRPFKWCRVSWYSVCKGSQPNTRDAFAGDHTEETTNLLSEYRSKEASESGVR